MRAFGVPHILCPGASNPCGLNLDKKEGDFLPALRYRLLIPVRKENDYV
jgi:hypothetical protein